jgi:hypothetical protein
MQTISTCGVRQRLPQKAAYLLFGLSLVATLVPTSVEAEESVRIIGSGANATCGRWTELRQSRINNSLEDWALAYISGAAVFTGRDALKNLDAYAIWRWLDNYCASNPFESVPDALGRLYHLRTD